MTSPRAAVSVIESWPTASSEATAPVVDRDGESDEQAGRLALDLAHEIVTAVASVHQARLRVPAALDTAGERMIGDEELRQAQEQEQRTRHTD